MNQRKDVYDVAIIGGGIVGLSTAIALLTKQPHARVVVIEKEDQWARHQTGRNSGVIHSGIYYKPGTRKALFARAGSQSMVEFCRTNNIEHEVCGKVIVATRSSQLGQLEALYERGRSNGLEVNKLTADELREQEPYCAGIAAIGVPSAGIVDYGKVCIAMVSKLERLGAELKTGQRVIGVTSGSPSVLTTETTDLKCRTFINCAGLHSDRVTKLDPDQPTPTADHDIRIVPFRGEYYQLKPNKTHVVKNLIYPVPNPEFNFLGVHFTRTIDGRIEAGPNAVLATKREGYNKNDFSVRDMADTVSYPGFWKLAAKHWREGGREIVRSISKRAFTNSLRELIPSVEEDDLISAPAGVRAQALRRDGTLEDDFHIVKTAHGIHVGNAPSPAATASIEIGTYIAGQVV